MSNNRCLYCKKIILDERTVCMSCERKHNKIGMILQSLNATKKDVEAAYDFLEENNDN